MVLENSSTNTMHLNSYARQQKVSIQIGLGDYDQAIVNAMLNLSNREAKTYLTTLQLSIAWRLKSKMIEANHFAILSFEHFPKQQPFSFPPHKWQILTNIGILNQMQGNTSAALHFFDLADSCGVFGRYHNWLNSIEIQRDKLISSRMRLHILLAYVRILLLPLYQKEIRNQKINNNNQNEIEPVEERNRKQKESNLNHRKITFITLIIRQLCSKWLAPAHFKELLSFGIDKQTLGTIRTPFDLCIYKIPFYILK